MVDSCKLPGARTRHSAGLEGVTRATGLNSDCPQPLWVLGEPSLCPSEGAQRDREGPVPSASTASMVTQDGHQDLPSRPLSATGKLPVSREIVGTGFRSG